MRRWKIFSVRRILTRFPAHTRDMPRIRGAETQAKETQHMENKTMNKMGSNNQTTSATNQDMKSKKSSNKSGSGSAATNAKDGGSNCN